MRQASRKRSDYLKGQDRGLNDLHPQPQAVAREYTSRPRKSSTTQIGLTCLSDKASVMSSTRHAFTRARYRLRNQMGEDYCLRVTTQSVCIKCSRFLAPLEVSGSLEAKAPNYVRMGLGCARRRRCRGPQSTRGDPY
jgi:hypothetical protein